MSTILQTDQPTSFFNFDAEKFRAAFPQLPFKINHDLSARRELQLPQLIGLASRLPEANVEYYAGNVPVNQDPKKYPKNRLSVVETVRRIEECGSWMVMKYVDVDPEYDRLMRTLLGEVYRELKTRGSNERIRDMHRESAFIFISSPNSVTPYHLDDEHNFLLQIRGTKQVSIWDPDDRTVMPERQAEEMLQCWHGRDYQRYMPYRDEFEKRANHFDLHPGDGLHFPFGAPHWVKNGPEVSISFSITFRSLMSERKSVVYYLNKRLRGLGLEPIPPGQSEWRDAMKYGIFQMTRRGVGVLRGSLRGRKLNDRAFKA